MNELDVINKIKKMLIQNDRDPENMLANRRKAYYSVKFFYTFCLRIKVGLKNSYISIPVYMRRQMKAAGIDLSAYDKRNGWFAIPFQGLYDLNNLKLLILEIYDYCELKITGEMFGCCSKYVECSNNLGCVQRDKKWHKACYYRLNLSEGKVFYGINKTIK